MENLKTSGYAPVNGLNMYYEIHGNSDIPLVLIHGGGSTIETSFGIILPMLSAHGKVIAVELQAHGRTNDRDTPESFMQDADDVAALLKYIKVDKANLLGFSNGGSTVMQIAIRHPEIVNKIIVVSGVYKREGLVPDFFGGLQNATMADMPDPLKTAYLAVGGDETGLQNMFNRDKERMLTFKDWEDDDLRSIKAPALIMSSDKDVITVEHNLKMSQLIPDAQLVILPGYHGAFIGDICTVKEGSVLPAITAELIREFLNE